MLETNAIFDLQILFFCISHLGRWQLHWPLSLEGLAFSGLPLIIHLFTLRIQQEPKLMELPF